MTPKDIGNYKCFVRDNDCHWYLIPVLQKEDFEQWVEASEKCNAWIGVDYDNHRCDNPCDYIFKDEMEFRS